ncbi:MAG: DUF1850 domain-containing protein [Pyrodictiaceae archaeon]
MALQGLGQARALLILLVLVLAPLTSIYFLEPIPIVLVKCNNSMFTVPIPPKGVLVIYNWTHSVEKTPIVEYYNVTPEGIWLVKALAKSFGAGHPYSAEELGGRYSLENGYMVYTAHYYIGPRLEAMGPHEYTAMVVIGAPLNVTCKGVDHLILEVVNASRASLLLGLR